MQESNEYVIVTNILGSDNWCQLYINGVLEWESKLPWEYIEPTVEAAKRSGVGRIVVEYVTDDEMENYSN